MNSKILLTSILFSIALLTKLTPPAHALGCVNIDVSNQVKLTCSKDAPGTQQNNVNQVIDPNSCVGNANVHNTTQTYVGTDGADQKRNSNQFSAGSGNSGPIPGNAINAGNVNIKAGTATTIYNPALDPNFLPKR
jgi:hypothetical protein